MKIQSRLVLMFALFLAVALTILGYVTFQRSRALLEASILLETDKEIHALGVDVLASLKSNRSDLLVIADNPASVRIFRAIAGGGVDPIGKSTTAQWTERLETTFEAFLVNNPMYTQLRLLDVTGHEVVRVDRDGEAIIVVQGEDLQDKSQYDYFKKAVVLPENSVFTSELNLNREHGRIETPHRPVLRFSTPVYEEDGQVKGVIVLNIDAKYMLDSLVHYRGNVFLVNSEGYFLKHTDSKWEFGFDLNTDYTLEKLHPGMLSLLTEHNSQVELAEGTGAQTGVELVRGFNKVAFDSFHPERYWAIVFDMPAVAVLAPVTELARTFFFMALVVLVLSGLPAYVMARHISSPITELTDVSGQVAAGNLAVVVPSFDRRDEIGTLTHSLDRMVQSLRAADADNRHRVWLITGQTKLGDTMRGGVDVATLAQGIITFLANYLGAQVGLLYIIEERGLTPAGSFAHVPLETHPRSFQPGEGLVGQALREQEPRILNDIPEDYIKIQSGLGDRSPRNLLIMPVAIGNEVKAVIELGSFSRFEDRHLEFLRQADEGIAISIASAQARQRLAELLEETQRQAETLQVQQEELRAANEELEAQTLALRESELRLREQQEELQASNEELEVSNEELEEQKKALQDRQRALEERNREVEQARREIERQTEELRLSSKYKSEFLANMSHELRTPLNSLLILSRLLYENKDENLTDKQVEYARTVHQSGIDLLELIDDILDLSKVEAGKLDVRVESVNLRDFTGKLYQLFSPISREKSLKFSCDIADAPGVMHTDPKRMEQILKNMISNAIKFTAEGSVALTVARPAAGTEFTRESLRAGGVIAFKVVDTGIGIPQDKQRLIFEAFQQADTGTSRKYGGTGLGLSIARELANLLGGEIQLHSEVGKGSEFILYLPEETPVAEKAQAAPQPTQFRKDTPAGGRSARTLAGKPTAARDREAVDDDRNSLQPGDRSVLVIDDDPIFIEEMFRIARELGFKCLAATDGGSGLHAARTLHPSAIVLDVKLPGVDGWRVFEQLKEDLVTRHIPVHMMSAYVGDEDARKRGAVGFLKKPASRESLQEVLAGLESVLTRTVKTVLIVEDNQRQLDSIRELLKNDQVRALAASTGQEACDALKAEPVDCIVLDLGLAGDMDGFALLETIRESDGLPHPPVVIYTGRDLSEAEEQRLAPYADSIVIKGARSPERLLDEVTLFLHQVETSLPETKRRMLKTLHPKDAALRDKSILLVDDDMRNIFAMSSILEANGMKVRVAKNGRESLEKLAGHKDIDLVFMDIMMPEMDGYEAMRKIREQSRFKDLPIIALTAKAMKDDREKCLEAGANDYLAKPVDNDRMLSLMRVWMYR